MSKTNSKYQDTVLDLKNHCQKLIYDSHIEFYDYCEKFGWNVKMPFYIYKVINRSCTLIIDDAVLTYWPKYNAHYKQ